MSLTMAEMIAALDNRLSDVTHIEWGEAGPVTSTHVARTAVTMEAAIDSGSGYAMKGIDVASPPLLSAAASGACTITHWRFTTASSGGTPQTSWNQLTTPIPLVSGGQITLGDHALYEKLTPVP